MAEDTTAAVIEGLDAPGEELFKNAQESMGMVLEAFVNQNDSSLGALYFYQGVAAGFAGAIGMISTGSPDDGAKVLKLDELTATLLELKNVQWNMFFEGLISAFGDSFIDSFLTWLKGNPDATGWDLKIDSTSEEPSEEPDDAP